MSKNLTEVDEYTASVTVPEDGDNRNAASVETPFQALANRSLNAKNRLSVVEARGHIVEAKFAYGDGGATPIATCTDGNGWQDIASVTLTEVQAGDLVVAHGFAVAHADEAWSAPHYLHGRTRLTQHPSGGSEAMIGGETFFTLQMAAELVTSITFDNKTIPISAAVVLASGNNNTITMQGDKGVTNGSADLEFSDLWGLTVLVYRNVST